MVHLMLNIIPSVMTTGKITGEMYLNMLILVSFITFITKTLLNASFTRDTAA